MSDNHNHHCNSYIFVPLDRQWPSSSSAERVRCRGRLAPHSSPHQSQFDPSLLRSPNRLPPDLSSNDACQSPAKLCHQRFFFSSRLNPVHSAIANNLILAITLLSRFLPCYVNRSIYTIRVLFLYFFYCITAKR